MCSAYLYMPLDVFWDSTPIEIDWALKSYFSKEDSRSQNSWEQLRTQIYFSYLFSPSGKRKVSFDTFKRDYLPFHFDKKEVVQQIDDDMFESIQKIFKEKTGVQK